MQKFQNKLNIVNFLTCNFFFFLKTQHPIYMDLPTKIDNKGNRTSDRNMHNLLCCEHAPKSE